MPETRPLRLQASHRLPFTPRMAVNTFRLHLIFPTGWTFRAPKAGGDIPCVDRATVQSAEASIPTVTRPAASASARWARAGTWHGTPLPHTVPSPGWPVHMPAEVHVRVCTQTHTHTHMPAHCHMHTPTHTSACMHSHTHTHPHTYTCVTPAHFLHIPTQLYTHTYKCLPGHIHMHTHVYKHGFRFFTGHGRAEYVRAVFYVWSFLGSGRWSRHPHSQVLTGDQSL